ncbi:hypothetical protein LTR66_003537 [Elasticomyces elasticus]|nr:hypothetical protein LTR28_004338 [Elasticomyces elasticus]KAK4996964.1 hypothetical protein LTR66_003537 [Elasticomyces elasticus]
MHPPLRIAILECDTPLDRTRAKYGGYGGVFEELLGKGADELNMPDVIRSGKGGGMDITKWDVEKDETYPNIDDIDAILITGSKRNSFDNTPWILKLVSFVQTLLEQERVRIIGVCFGHQIVGRAMGMKVDRSQQGWELSVTPVELTPKGKELFRQEDLHLHQMHRDIVYAYPPHVDQLAHSPLCAVQGMHLQNRLLTVQGHPEFTRDIVTEILASRRDQGIFDEAMYQDGMRRVGDRHDGVVVAVAFLRFLLQD